MEKKDRPDYFKRWDKLWEKFDEWLIRNNTTPLKACLNFVMNFQEISKIVLGVESLKQLSEINSYEKNVEMTLTPFEINVEDIDELLNPSLWKVK